MRHQALWIRARAVRAVRDFFWERGFLEVETPLLIPANAPEEYIEPVVIPPFFLQTSPEICMKRLLCRGHDKLFQICHCWRAGERGSRHLSEFTMLEWYRADSDYEQLMTDCTDLLHYVVTACSPGNQYLRYNGRKIDPFLPWQRMTLSEAFQRFGNTSIRDILENGSYEEILTGQVEPALAEYASPVIVSDFPVELAALSRLKNDDRTLAERFELYVGGLELANGFSELNDPNEQRRRFQEANTIRTGDGRPSLPLPEPFLAELANMPPSAGIALGVDRLVMLLAGCSSIDEVVAFTPEEL